MLEAAVLLLLVGALSGALGGMLGIGDGVVIVPALILIFEATQIHPSTQITVTAVATSMAVIIFTSFSAAYSQYRAGKILWPVMRKLTPVFVLGSFCAGLITPWLDAWLLRGLIGAFLCFVGVTMLLAWRPDPERQMPGLLPMSGIGFGGGLVSGAAGIAGGNVIVPTLVYFNIPVHNATATSSAMGVLIALSGALGYILGVNQASAGDWMLGYVDLRSWLWITLAAIAAAPLGVRLAHRLPAALLKRVFGGFLLLVALRMLYSAYLLTV
ncbi:MAG: sulfite exporter TauE/SafE family protein [Pseudomonadales bacterium]